MDVNSERIKALLHARSMLPVLTPSHHPPCLRVPALHAPHIATSPTTAAAVHTHEWHTVSTTPCTFPCFPDTLHGFLAFHAYPLHVCMARP